MSSTVSLKGQELKGWETVNSGITNSEIRLDKGALANTKSAYLTSSEEGYENSLNIFQRIKADDYRSKRQRFSFIIKTKIEGDAGLVVAWVRVDGTAFGGIKFDNMSNRPISGKNDWLPYDIVLDVPESSAVITFGVILVGAGGAWVDNILIETVDTTVETTGSKVEPVELTTGQLEKLLTTALEKPVNLDFGDN